MAVRLRQRSSSIESGATARRSTPATSYIPTCRGCGRYWQASPSACAGPTAARLDMLRRATALWRDEEPLQGLTGPWIDGSRQRLRQQWLSAVISRYDLELGHGQHVAMIDELTGLVQRNPTVEPLAGQLMIALHRSGRHCEALDTYQRTRAALIEIG